MTKSAIAAQAFASGHYVCEYQGAGFCCQPTDKRYVRSEKDAKDWPENYPIPLCDKHKGKKKLYEETTNTRIVLPYWLRTGTDG